MLERLSKLIAKKIKEADPDGPGTVEIFEYELGIRLNLVATIILTSLFGWLLGHFVLSLLSLMVFVLIRKVSGGVHISSLTLCAVVSALIFSIIPFIDFGLSIKVLLSCISLVIFFKYAPADFIEVYSATDPQKLKWLSVLFAFIGLLTQSNVIILTILIQSLTVLPVWRGGGEGVKQNSSLHVQGSNKGSE